MYFYVKLFQLWNDILCKYNSIAIISNKLILIFKDK
jgi:hypothetical protein